MANSNVLLLNVKLLAKSEVMVLTVKTGMLSSGHSRDPSPVEGSYVFWNLIQEI